MVVGRVVEAGVVVLSAAANVVTDEVVTRFASNVEIVVADESLGRIAVDEVKLMGGVGIGGGRVAESP